MITVSKMVVVETEVPVEVEEEVDVEIEAEEVIEALRFVGTDDTFVSLLEASSSDIVIDIIDRWAQKQLLNFQQKDRLKQVVEGLL